MQKENFTITERKKSTYTLKDRQKNHEVNVETYIIEEISQNTEKSKDSIAILLAQIYSIYKNAGREEQLRDDDLIFCLEEVLVSQSATEKLEMLIAKDNIEALNRVITATNSVKALEKEK